MSEGNVEVDDGSLSPAEIQIEIDKGPPGPPAKSQLDADLGLDTEYEAPTPDDEPTYVKPKVVKEPEVSDEVEAAEEDSKAEEDEFSDMPEPVRNRMLELKDQLKSEQDSRRRDREGLLRDLTQARRARREEPTPSASPEQVRNLVDSGKIPTKFDAAGKPYIDAADLTRALIEQGVVRAPRTQAEQFEDAHANIRRGLIDRDPAKYTEPSRELQDSYQFLQETVAKKVTEIGPPNVRAFDDIIDWMERTGVADELRAKFPNVAPDRGALFDLVDTANSVSGIKSERLLHGYMNRRSGAKKLVIPDGARNASASTTPDLNTERPRAQADRGKSIRAVSSGKIDNEMAALEAKDFDKWTDKDSDRYLELVRKMDKIDGGDISTKKMRE